MPRIARIDALGALHHIIVRGIERLKIFYEKETIIQWTSPKFHFNKAPGCFQCEPRRLPVIFSVTSWGSASPAATWIALQTAAGTTQASQHPN
jgi:hypothetical protein